MEELFKIDNLNELESYLKNQGNIKTLRESLFNQFLKYADYRNAEDWNKAVIICESLAIIGWGSYEPLEALRGFF